MGSYMAVKNRKLHDQFEAEASTSSHSGSSSEKPIFHGVSIFVDGYTVPSSQVCTELPFMLFSPFRQCEHWLLMFLTKFSGIERLHVEAWRTIRKLFLKAASYSYNLQ